MAALVAVRHNPALHTFCRRLLASGKARKFALVAAMRMLSPSTPSSGTAKHDTFSAVHAPATQTA